MISQGEIKKFSSIETPFYFYDINLLKKTLSEYVSFLDKYGYEGHYALKANAEPKILEIIKDYGFGADCVSGNEVDLAIKSGFPAEKIFFAGVGKTDKEIKNALGYDIGCFNCESIQEMEVLNEIAGKMGKMAGVALRINPDIDAHTIKYISTGMDSNKFGISEYMFDEAIKTLKKSDNIVLKGLHFHIGSQITDMKVFELLCSRVTEIEKTFTSNGLEIKNIDLGGGLGIDYENPEENPIADFKSFFETIHANLNTKPGQIVHFEPGRELVAQCGSLISRVLYIKKGKRRKFAIIDAGMNDLIRPALYHARHNIVNITSEEGRKTRYDVVGPICESSDKFATACMLYPTERGDMLEIKSAGAYGQTMGMRYNQKDLAKAYYSDDAE
ncbi:MAG: diaminopimelate decarboxylase [Bacteroidales bacterium]|jgi:diaminopimelate decarboxylase|nr:diaminopimelate decarboxylase [Bacteroidales bacterium]